jgi:hypothetical protein
MVIARVWRGIMERILYAVLLAAGCLFGVPHAYAQAKMAPARINEVRVVCDSRGFGRQHCPSDLRGFVFASVRNASSVRCEVGRNFGYDDSGVWVDQGCRGEFFFAARGDSGAGYGAPGQGADLTVRCESRDGRRGNCPADLRGYYFRDLRQISRTQCVQGNNWGFDDRGVWVDQGCRADFVFAAGRYAGPGGAGGSQQVIGCASRDGRRANCPADLRGYTLANVRQQSRTQCVLGQNFGYDDRGVWVDQGCRAEFAFDFRGPGFGGTGYGAPSVTTQRCESVDNRRAYCELPRGVRVRLVKQLSRAACTESSTWGVDQRGLWVDDGCRAEFEIYR